MILLRRFRFTKIAPSLNIAYVAYAYTSALNITCCSPVKPYRSKLDVIAQRYCYPVTLSNADIGQPFCQCIAPSIEISIRQDLLLMPRYNTEQLGQRSTRLGHITTTDAGRSPCAETIEAKC